MTKCPAERKNECLPYLGSARILVIVVVVQGAAGEGRADFGARLGCNSSWKLGVREPGLGGQGHSF